MKEREKTERNIGKERKGKERVMKRGTRGEEEGENINKKRLKEKYSPE